jgi:hypothetical protein
MQAIKAKFDGRRVVLPPHFKHKKPGNVVVVFEDAGPGTNGDTEFWLQMQEQTLKKIWENPEDDIYDEL